MNAAQIYLINKFEYQLRNRLPPYIILTRKKDDSGSSLVTWEVSMVETKLFRCETLNPTNEFLELVENLGKINNIEIIGFNNTGSSFCGKPDTGEEV